jgi:predicted dehydrogenase
MTDDTLRVLQVGAGSMGTRRLRDLSLRKDVALAVLETRADRREAAAARFGVPAFLQLKDALEWGAQALTISTPPDAHSSFIEYALQNGLHHFCEANIWTPEWQHIERVSRMKRLISASSCTFHFHPLVATLKDVVHTVLGKIHAFQFCLSTFMPSWHPGEGQEFYARRRSTAAAREMVPFELLWLQEIFGECCFVSGKVNQHAAFGNPLEDSWSLQIELRSGAIGQLSVLMGCPTTCRRGWCLGDEGIVDFDLGTGNMVCRTRDATEQSWSFGNQEQVEDLYRREIHAFVDAIRGVSRWPLEYREASRATATLAAAEVSSLSSFREEVRLERQPGVLATSYEIAHHQPHLSVRHRLPPLTGDTKPIPSESP